MIVNELPKAKLPFLALCSYGRSGTTVYMKLLKSMGFNVEGEVPFEDRTLQVSFIRWLQEQIESTTRSGEPLPRNHAVFGKITYKSEAGRSWEETAAFETQVVEWLSRLREAGKRGVAEKFVGSALLRSMKGFDDNNSIRPVFLLRDPRDVFISVKGFNEKRGFASFNDSGDDKKLFGIICGFMREQLRMQRRFGGLVTRYEDLIVNPRRAIFDTARLCSTEPVQVDYVDEVVERFSQVTDKETMHMTSDSSEDSVDRWRNHRFAEFRPIFDTAKPAIVEIGYPV